MKQWAPRENHLLDIGSSLKKKSTLNSDRRQTLMQFDKISRNIYHWRGKVDLRICSNPLLCTGSSLKKITSHSDNGWIDDNLSCVV